MISAQRQWTLLLAGMLIFLALGVHFLNQTPDDVFITLRYAANLAAGHGPVYNIGERVEGFSNPLLLALLALLHLLMSDPRALVLAAKGLGLLAGLLTLLALYALARRDPEGAEFRGWPPLLFALAGYPALWAASGMETALHALLIVVALGGYLRALETGRKAWRVLAGPIFALVALSRPEGIVFLFAALLARALLLWRDKRKPDAADAGFLALALAPILLYFLWRHSFYGAWWPNTFYAKASAGPATYADGVRYLLPAIGATLWGNALLLPLLLLGLLPWKKTSPRTLLLLLGIGAQAGFMVLGGGDWMLGWRFAVPAMAPVALLAPTILARLRDALHRQRLAEWFAGARKWIFLLALALPFAVNLYAVKQLGVRPSGWRGPTAHLFVDESYLAVADHLHTHRQPGDRLATGEAGAIVYLTGLPTIDCFGLTDAHLARVPGKRHEKVDPDYILGRRPTWLVIGGVAGPDDAPTSYFAYGRSLLAHPTVKETYRPVLRRDSFLVLQRRPAAVADE